MSNQKALIKISLQGIGDAFLMSEYEPKNCLTLKILDIKRNKSYVGQVSDLDLRTQAAKIRLTFCDFIEKSLRALFHTQKRSDFIYTLDQNDNLYTFNWKSVDEEETVIDIGSIQMNDQSYVSIFDTVLLSLASEIRQLNSRIKTLSADLVNYKDQAENAMSQLSDALEIKNSLEEEMYSKFLLVLNEKKRKIVELSGKKLPQKSFTDHNHNTYKSKKQKSHIISDSSDDEKAEFPDINQPGPSKSNAVLFSDEDDATVIPVKTTKVRNRKNGNKKRCFNVEPGLPKTNTVLFSDEDDSLVVPANSTELQNRKKVNKKKDFNNEPVPSKMNAVLFSDEDDALVVPVKPTKMRNRNEGSKKRTFNDDVMSSNVESVLSQVIDDDSDDSLLGKL